MQRFLFGTTQIIFGTRHFCQMPAITSQTEHISFKMGKNANLIDPLRPFQFDMESRLNSPTHNYLISQKI